ncbi:MAG: MATE family efflux transporter [Oscillospiraceae bacterium]|nr:MATE family efflux transporter [Oscillospiraceae bacterium]
MAQTRDEELGNAPIPSLVVKLALPAITAQIINLLYNIIDRVYIGHIPEAGDKALTGVGVTFPIILLISAFSQLVGAGGAPLAAISLGKGERERAQKMLRTAFFSLLCISAILTCVLQIIKHPVLMAFGASEDTVGYGESYLFIYLWGTVFVQMSLGLNPFITCQGRSGTAMLTVLIGAVLNIILDPVFIFVLGMGVRGAALATVISQAASAVWTVSFLRSDKSGIRLSFGKPYIDLALLGSICALGVSPFIMQFTECLINVVFNSGLKKYGGDLYVGSMTIMQSVMQLLTVLSAGFNQGVQPIISFNYGAKKPERVRAAYRICFVTSISVMGILTCLVMTFPRAFGGIFTDEAALLDAVCEFMPMFVCGMTIFGIQNAAQCAFVGLGQAKISLFLACLRKVILLIPLALILPRFMGVRGIYLAEPVSDITSALTAGTLFLLNINKILQTDGGAKRRS